MELPSVNKILYKITLLDKLLFVKHLSVMLKSGIPLSDAIASLKDQTKNPFFKQTLEKVLSDINNGQSLEEALTKHPDVFDTLYLSLISTGEKSGNLETNLEYLSTQLKKNYDFNKKVQSATLYPKLVLGLTLIIGWSLALFVLPKLVELFKSLEVELPLSTKILLFLAEIMKNYGIWIVSALVILITIITMILKTPPVKPKWHKFILSLPVIGSLNQQIELASICRNLGIMLKSGITITSALEAQQKATDNLVFKTYITEFASAVEKGKKLSEQMTTKNYPFIPAIVPKMIEVGEETGNLDEVLIYLGDFFEEEVDNESKNLSSTLEPILLLIIGVVVAYFALAVISPIYQLTGSIRK